MLTTIEAREQLHKRFPLKTICVEEQAWVNENGHYLSYSVAFLTGFDGSPCQYFMASTLQKALDSAVAAGSKAAINAGTDPDKEPSKE